MANYKGDNAAESILSTVAKVFLVLGIVVTVLMAILSMMVYSGYGVGVLGKLLGGLIVLVIGLVVCFVIWASYMVIINISNNVRDSRKLLETQCVLLERQNQLLEESEKRE